MGSPPPCPCTPCPPHQAQKGSSGNQQQRKPGGAPSHRASGSPRSLGDGTATPALPGAPLGTPSPSLALLCPSFLAPKATPRAGHPFLGTTRAHESPLLAKPAAPASSSREAAWVLAALPLAAASPSPPDRGLRGTGEGVSVPDKSPPASPTPIACPPVLPGAPCHAGTQSCPATPRQKQRRDTSAR